MKPSDGVCSDSAAKARSTGGAASGAHESSRSARRLDNRPSAAAFISETTANSVRAGGGNIRTGRIHSRLSHLSLCSLASRGVLGSLIRHVHHFCRN